MSSLDAHTANKVGFKKNYNNCVWNYSLKQNEKSLAAHSKISAAHQRAAAHRLRNTDLWDKDIIVNSIQKCYLWKVLEYLLFVAVILYGSKFNATGDFGN